ncbi:MAG TPA: tetratricopeptide repeat protein, partial [Myxococcota bacterium]|nr:tetratricopeptide repeat protein [Myxococcota bacterium]
AERRRRAGEARRHLRASLTLDESSASVRLDLAKVATHLQEWEEAEAWLQAAGRRRPGALAVDLALARLQWSRGWDAAARLQARDVLSRTSWHPFAEEARRYLQPAP